MLTDDWLACVFLCFFFVCFLFLLSHFQSNENWKQVKNNNNKKINKLIEWQCKQRGLRGFVDCVKILFVYILIDSITCTMNLLYLFNCCSVWTIQALLFHFQNNNKKKVCFYSNLQVCQVTWMPESSFSIPQWCVCRQVLRVQMNMCVSFLFGKKTASTKIKIECVSFGTFSALRLLEAMELWTFVFFFLANRQRLVRWDDWNSSFQNKNKNEKIFIDREKKKRLESYGFGRREKKNQNYLSTNQICLHSFWCEQKMQQTTMKMSIELEDLWLNSYICLIYFHIWTSNYILFVCLLIRERNWMQNSVHRACTRLEFLFYHCMCVCLSYLSCVRECAKWFHGIWNESKKIKCNAFNKLEAHESFKKKNL